MRCRCLSPPRRSWRERQGQPCARRGRWRFERVELALEIELFPNEAEPRYRFGVSEQQVDLRQTGTNRVGGALAAALGIVLLDRVEIARTARCPRPGHSPRPA